MNLEQKFLDKMDETLTKIEKSLPSLLRGYISTLETIASREYQKIDTENMDTEQLHYFKGRISAFEAVADDLAKFLEEAKP